MPLTPEDVNRIAMLARLDLSTAERAAMLSQLNGFFGIVEQMSAVDTSGVEPLYTPLSAVQAVALRLRDDVVTETDQRDAQPAPAHRWSRTACSWCRRSSNERARCMTLGVAAARPRAARPAAVSSLELTQHLLTRVAAFEHLGAFLARDPSCSLAQAARGRRAPRRAARPQPLTGVPIAHKDIFVTRALPSTAGSKMLAGYASPFDATVGGAPVATAGMVTLGKLNCDEFAMGSANENSAFGAVKNPWDTQRVPGGSSGGSAAAVAARLVPAATGTDTGGSIRQPASLQRRHRHQADLRRVLALRHDRLRLQPGPGRPAGAQRRGLRACCCRR